MVDHLYLPLDQLVPVHRGTAQVRPPALGPGTPPCCAATRYQTLSPRSTLRHACMLATRNSRVAFTVTFCSLPCLVRMLYDVDNVPGTLQKVVLPTPFRRVNMTRRPEEEISTSVWPFSSLTTRKGFLTLPGNEGERKLLYEGAGG
ncbi:hypothetical protein BaRGS_00008215 [Batillaria attramentaria]|uniref:Uncharacterized protein n=1 Tax=Batillaria attramentaria TaxID=370345 RepID=A0ABD0LMV8_9CAEN